MDTTDSKGSTEASNGPTDRATGTSDRATGGPGRAIDRPDRATADALARFYDLDLHDDPGDLDLYLALAERTGGPILELAAGTGRLAVPLAAAGNRVTAVDIDPAMLARTTDRAAAAGPAATAHLECVEADLIGLRLPDAGSYGLAFIALNSLMLLDRAGQRAAFETLARHLAPDGVAVVDVWLPDTDDLARFDGRIILEWPRLDPETGEQVTKSGSAQHDGATGTIDLTTMFESSAQGGPVRRWVRRDRLHLVSARDIVTYAEEAALVVELLAAAYDLTAFGPGSERAILIATKPRSGA